MVNNLNRPSIFVYGEDMQESLLKEILAGIEEEGIPYNLIKELSINKKSFVSKIYTLSNKSRMGIAVGMKENRLVLHYNKLKEDEPLLDTKLYSYDKQKARKLGSNAARLYKMMPFKDLEDDKVDEKLVRLITEAVIKTLKI